MPTPTPAFPAPRRVFTTPTSTSHYRPTEPSRPAEGLVETLYNHPSVKIVSFTAGPRSISLDPRHGLAASDVAPGSLPWSSQLERTIAVGSFRIYRAPGSVAFLSCGSALQPILPKSQCWCVDESSSKFVLQIRRPQYWRIEIPTSGDDGSLLRAVLDTILQFEKTECPFKRSFTVVLPEKHSTPVKKRPWTPVRRASSVTFAPTAFTPMEAKSPATTQTHRCENGSVLREDAAVSMSIFREDKADLREDKGVSREDKEISREDRAVSEEHKAAASISVSPLSRQAHDSSFNSGRSLTDPPQLTVVTASPPRSVSRPLSKPVAESAESQSPTGSQDSFHSVQSWHSLPTPLPPSPPLSDPASPMTFRYPHDNIVIPKKSVQRECSEPTITPNTPQTWTVSATGATEPNYATGTPSVSEAGLAYLTLAPAVGSPSSSDLTTTINAARSPPVRPRATTSSSISLSRRALSPPPPAANIFIPRPNQRSVSPRSKLAVVGQLPMAVISKTCEILLSPPSHLVNLMLKVAARIAAGEWRGLVLGTGSSGEQIPVAWDWSDEPDVCGNTGGRVARGLTHRSRSMFSLREERPRKMVGSYPSDDEDDWIYDEGSERNGEDAVSAGADEEETLDGVEWARSWGVD